MPSPSRYIADAVAVLGIGVLCLPILLLLMPHIEMASSEARIAVAYYEVRRLRDSLATERLAQPATLPDRDPWGQPYRIVPLADGGVRIVSSGPNKSSPPDGADEDDIYSDMPGSPSQAVRDRKKRQSLLAVGVTGVAWVSLASLYPRSRRRHDGTTAHGDAPSP